MKILLCFPFPPWRENFLFSRIANNSNPIWSLRKQKKRKFYSVESQWVRERFLLMLLVYAYIYGDIYNNERKAESYILTPEPTSDPCCCCHRLVMLTHGERKYVFSMTKKFPFFFGENFHVRERQEVSFKWNSEKKKESQNGINGKRENVYSKYMKNIHKFYYDDDVIWLLNWDNLFRKFIHCWRSSNREFISTLEIS